MKKVLSVLKIIPSVIQKFIEIQEAVLHQMHHLEFESYEFFPEGSVGKVFFAAISIQAKIYIETKDFVATFYKSFVL